MSEKLSIVHEWRTITITKPLNALVQSVLEEACSVLKISDPGSVKLVVEKGEKHIDHSLTLRMANIKAATKLALIKSVPPQRARISGAHHEREAVVAVTLSWKDETHTQLFPVSATLHEVLEGFEEKVPVPAAATDAPASSASSSSSVPAPSPSARGSPRWTGWTGIPAPEVNAQFEVHIHVPGWMAPVLEVGVRKVAGAELRSLRLSSLGAQSDSAQPSKLKMRLSHSYTAPVRTEEEQKEVMDNFHRKYHAMMGGAGAATASASSAPAPRPAGAGVGAGVCPARSTQHVKFADAAEECEDIEAGSDSDSEDPAAAAAVEIPGDRRIALLHALPGMLPAPELPDEFYEVTDEDSLAYARALRMEADRARASFGLPPTDLPLDGAASAASLHRAAVVAQTALGHHSAPSDAPGAGGHGGLMDSARLPPVPQKKRSARRRRACHATMIRVRLPDHLYVEGLFKAEETPADLYRWMDSLLLPVAPAAAAAAAAASAASAEGGAGAAPSPTSAASPAPKHPDYYLYITPPRQQLGRHSRLTFAQLGLLPAALVHYGTSAQGQVQQGVGAFAVERDTPEQLAAAREANPARGLLRDEWAEKVKKIMPPPVVRRAPEAGAAADEKSDAEHKETTNTERAAAEAATAASSPQAASPNAMD